MNYHFKFYQSKSGYWAKCIELDGCVTQADTKEELLKNAREALNLHLEEANNPDVLYARPLEKVSGRNIVKIYVDPVNILKFAERDMHIQLSIEKHSDNAG